MASSSGSTVFSKDNKSGFSRTRVNIHSPCGYNSVDFDLLAPHMPPPHMPTNLNLHCFQNRIYYQTNSMSKYYYIVAANENGTDQTVLIGVAPITQVRHVHNKYIHWRSLNVINRGYLLFSGEYQIYLIGSRTKHPGTKHPMPFFDTPDKTSHKDLPPRTKHPMQFLSPRT